MADPETLVPRMAGVLEEERLRALPLAAVDRFVLSLVDGATSVKSLAETVGLSVEEVLASLLKLEAMRVVSLPSSSAPRPPPQATAARAAPVVPAPSPPTAPTAPASQPRALSPAAPQAATQRPAPAAAPPPAPSDAEIDLDPDHRRDIDATFASLEAVDHYVVLGLARGADKKAIKRAYFERTSRFHPDRFFRKRLGAYKAKMEAVFGRMTEAHDTLTSNERRAEYDAYLTSIEKTRGIEQMLAEAMGEMKRAEEAIGAVVAAAGPLVTPAPAARATAPAPAPSPSPVPRSPLSSPKPPANTATSEAASPNLGAFIADALDGRGPSKPAPASAGRISVTPARSEPPGARERRELLARRLTGGSMRVPAAPKVPAISYAKTEDAVDALKRRYEEKVSAARVSQARKYLDAGNEAKAKGDLVAAANAFRVALGFDPDNAELKASHEESQREADHLLVEQYLKQAEYEERSERWADAGRSWARVARAQLSNAKAYERAAFCMTKADGDLHEAAALGQRAVQLEPKNVHYRRTMANVYLAAGLTLNAKRELEAALQLAPDDPSTTALLKRIAKSS